MPRYEFRCEKCGSEIEITKSIHDESVPFCCEEGCGALPMVQQISLSSFHLKGLGWAAEGYSKTGID
jgi:putative FmdB family regulatory protein